MSVFSNDIDLNILLHGLERYAADLPQESTAQIHHAINALQQQQAESEQRLIDLMTQDTHLDRLYEKALADRRSGYMSQERAKSLGIGISTPLTAEISQVLNQLAQTIDRILTKTQTQAVNIATEQILKILEKSHLTTQELTAISQTPQQTETILRDLWHKGYIDRLSAPFPYILLPNLRNAQYRTTFPSPDAFLTLTAKGYFHLYPLIKRPDRLVSA